MSLLLTTLLMSQVYSQPQVLNLAPPPVVQQNQVVVQPQSQGLPQFTIPYGGAQFLWQPNTNENVNSVKVRVPDFYHYHYHEYQNQHNQQNQYYQRNDLFNYNPNTMCQQRTLPNPFLQYFYCPTYNRIIAVPQTYSSPYCQ